MQAERQMIALPGLINGKAEAVGIDELGSCRDAYPRAD